MARNDSPPFERGQTFYGGATIDATDLTTGSSLEGKEYQFEDCDYRYLGTQQQGFGAFPERSGKPVRVRVVRNMSGTTLYAKRLVHPWTQSTSGDRYGCWVDGMAATLACKGWPVDEFIGAAGVPPNDLFYVVVQGPAKILTDTSALTANINNGDPVVAATAAASTSSGTTSAGGRINSQTLTALTGQALADPVRNEIGHALSAVTTGQTNTDVLVDVVYKV